MLLGAGVGEQPDVQPDPEVSDGVAVGELVSVEVGVAVAVAVSVGVDDHVGCCVVDHVLAGVVVGALVAVGELVGLGVGVAVAVLARVGDGVMDPVWPVFTVCVPPDDCVIAVATPATMATQTAAAAVVSSHRFRPRRREP